VTREQKKVAKMMEGGARLFGWATKSGEVRYGYLFHGEGQSNVILHGKVFKTMVANGLVVEVRREPHAMGTRVVYSLPETKPASRRKEEANV